MSMTILSFGFWLILFVGVGLASAVKKESSTSDYLLANRAVSPWLVALSAVATANSGFMFIGLIGETYSQGLSAMWVMVGWVLGDYLMWSLRIPDKIRETSEKRNALTMPTFIGGGLKRNRIIINFCAVLILLFLGLYAAAQLNAGSKALAALFDWEPSIGAFVGAIMVVIYCFAGGIRASIWTDAFQSIVMFVAMSLLCIVSLSELGGVSGMWSALEKIDPQLTDLFPQDVPGGAFLFMLGWLFAGAGVVGQPHIMVRTMAIDSPLNMGKARKVYVLWNAGFAALAILAGLAARAYLEPSSVTDAEQALPILAQQLLPDVLVGLVLAGVFAATMSTADSQILTCSSAITQDLIPQLGKSYSASKVCTVGITAAVLAIALGGGSVFELIVLAWSVLAASLGPLVIIRALSKPLNGSLALAMVIAGLVTVLIWRFVLGWTGYVYDACPGMICGGLVYLLGSKFQAPEHRLQSN